MNNGNNPAMFRFMPVAPPVVNARSPTGCWTCRVRRKKCDEFKPECKACSERNIICHWGPKPDWYDGGEEEKKRTNEIKQEVKKNSIRRRLMIRGGLLPPSESSRRSDESTALLRSQTPSPFDPTSNYTPAPGSVFSLISNANTSSSQSINSTYDDNHDSAYSFSMATKDEPNSSSISLVEPYQQGDQMVRDNFFYYLKTRDQQVPHSIRRGGSGCNLAYCRTRDATALSSQYFEEVLPCQFSLPLKIQASSHSLREWLIPLILQSPSLYNLSLCLTVYHIQASWSHGCGCPNESEFSMEYSRYYSLGLEQMRVILEGQNSDRYPGGHLPLEASVEVLLGIMFLEALERYRGGVDWQMHIDAALSLLPLFAESRYRTKASNSDMSNIESAEEFVVGFLVSLDILLCTSDAYKTRLKISHEELLRSSDVDLLEIMGCDGWVMVGIARINALRQWKSDMQKLETLSIPELVRQANEIEELLKSRLKFVEERTKTGSQTKAQYTGISEIYIHSALTYLNVVVSGAFPELLEIRKTVAQTLCQMQRISDPHILLNLIWPLLITGCMASKRQQSQFLKIIEDNCERWKKENGTFNKTLQIVKTAWNLREGGEKNCDWSSAMKKLGYQILFL